MSTRTRNMVLDGHSLTADMVIPEDTKEKVGIAILDVLTTFGPVTDDELVRLYDYRREFSSGFPKVTPQRIRTARASLTRKGIIIDSGQHGRSDLGNPATVWTIKEVAK